MAKALTWTKAVKPKLWLTINDAKTLLKNARRESFDFLGYTLALHQLPNGGRGYLEASPSSKSVQRVKIKIVRSWCRATRAPGTKCGRD